MRVRQITSQHRFDFSAIMICEHCGHTAELKTGYNDEYYNQHVIPSMLCAECGLNRAGTKEKTDDGVTVQTI
jgi:hypothetical protein